MFLRFATVFIWGAVEHVNARWLPWWRRYAAFAVLWITYAVDYAGYEGLAVRLHLVATGVYIWNCWTAARNRRNGNDRKEAEAKQAELTAVQARSWHQQVAEAQ